MTTKLETLEAALRNALGGYLQNLTVALGEVTVVVKAADYLSAMRVLRDHADTRFEQLIDLCGVDYSTYGDGAWEGPRFAVVSHLMSIAHNWRVRVRVFARMTTCPSWPRSIRFGTRLAGTNVKPRFLRHPLRRSPRPAPHPDRLWLHRPPVPQGLPGVRLCRDALRRRTETRHLSTVTIEPREITPRIIREENYGIK